MLRSNVFMAMIAGSLAIAAPLGAAHAELKIGVVDSQRLFNESPQLKAVLQSMQDEFSVRERDLQQQQKDLKAKSEKLQRDAAIMSEADRNKAERELRDGQRDLERKAKEFEDDANYRKNEELGKLQRAILAEVNDFAKSGGYDLIVSQGVLYTKDALDITPQILSTLQQRAAKSAGPQSGSAAKAPKPATPAKP
jgi:outer membrane protein